MAAVLENGTTLGARKWNPVTALGQSLAEVNLGDLGLDDDQKTVALLMEQIHPGKSDARMGLILNEKDRGRARDVAEMWKDVDRRNQYLEDASIAPDEDLGDMWEATGAWLNHANNPVPGRLIEYIDDAVKELMPPNTEIVSIVPHGVSSWSRSACIETIVDGEPIMYFLKVTPSISGKIMFHGEFEGLKAIFSTLPDFCPEPIGWGTYASELSVHFFLSRFIDMLDEPPDPELLPEKVAELHKKAVAEDGKYGFHVPTTAGLLPVKVAKGDSWEDFFTRYVRYLLRAEQLAQGPPVDPAEYQRLTKVMLDRLIPRLLRPLETGGREIVPRLMHTDLWDGNTAIDTAGMPIIYDPCALYGHNEFEIGVWSCPRITFGPVFINKYHQFFERSSPEEDHDGRNQLYLAAFEIRASVTIVGNGFYRAEMLRHIAELEKKYPETYEEWAKARGEEVCPMKGTTEKAT